MQQRPDASTLLEAVAQFLLTDVAPNIQDKALVFKIMIAANLAGTVALELKSDDERMLAELRAFSKLLPEVTGASWQPGSSRAERAEALQRYSKSLAAGLQEDRFSAAQLAELTRQVKDMLRASLNACNPRFDTSADLD